MDFFTCCVRASSSKYEEITCRVIINRIGLYGGKLFLTDAKYYSKQKIVIRYASKMQLPLYKNYTFAEPKSAKIFLMFHHLKEFYQPSQLSIDDIVLDSINIVHRIFF